MFFVIFQYYCHVVWNKSFILCQHINFFSLSMCRIILNQGPFKIILLTVEILWPLQIWILSLHSMFIVVCPFPTFLAISTNAAIKCGTYV